MKNIGITWLAILLGTSVQTPLLAQVATLAEREQALDLSVSAADQMVWLKDMASAPRTTGTTRPLGAETATETSR